MLIDRFGRPLTHMRVSVTLRCNHSCIFCHREGIRRVSSYELSPNELGLIAKVASKLGITNYKITGGEPLVRNDIAEIIEAIRPYASVISITTNGSLLSGYVKELANAGIDYINVSLHSLRPNVFKLITGGDVDKVLRGIKDALDHGIKLKIDFLLIKHNLSEVKDIINFASLIGADLNIIELIPLGLTYNEWRELHVGIDGLSKELEEIATRKYLREFQLRPTYVLPTGIKVTLVKGYCNPNLCRRCTRIRLTPDGRLKTCLYRDEPTVSLLSAVRVGDEEGIRDALIKANKLREPFFK